MLKLQMELLLSGKYYLVKIDLRKGEEIFA